MTAVSGLPAVGKEEVTSTKKVPYGKAAKATVVPTNATACANYIMYATKEGSDDLLAFGINQVPRAPCGCSSPASVHHRLMPSLVLPHA